MIPALQFRNWQWLALTLASPSWFGVRCRFTVRTNARHHAATMDTLIRLGVGAAYLWSLWALFIGHAGGRRGCDAVHPAAGIGVGDRAHLPRSRCCGDRVHPG